MSYVSLVKLNDTIVKVIGESENIKDALTKLFEIKSVNYAISGKTYNVIKQIYNKHNKYINFIDNLESVIINDDNNIFELSCKLLKFNDDFNAKVDRLMSDNLLSSVDDKEYNAYITYLVACEDKHLIMINDEDEIFIQPHMIQNSSQMQIETMLELSTSISNITEKYATYNNNQKIENAEQQLTNLLKTFTDFYDKYNSFAKQIEKVSETVKEYEKTLNNRLKLIEDYILDNINTTKELKEEIERLREENKKLNETIDELKKNIENEKKNDSLLRKTLYKLKTYAREGINRFKNIFKKDNNNRRDYGRDR